MDASKVCFEGTLEKTSGIFKNKAKVWMVLQDLSLTYYKNNKRSSCIGSVDMMTVQSVTQNKKMGGGKKFEIITATNTYHFEAETAELCEAWVSVLHQSLALKSSSSGSDFAMSQDKDRNTVTSEDMSDTSPGKQRTSSSSYYDELDAIPSSPTVFGVKLKSTRQSRRSCDSTVEKTSSSSSSVSPNSARASADSRDTKFSFSKVWEKKREQTENEKINNNTNLENHSVKGDSEETINGQDETRNKDQVSRLSNESKAIVKTASEILAEEEKNAEGRKSNESKDIVKNTSEILAEEVKKVEGIKSNECKDIVKTTSEILAEEGKNAEGRNSDESKDIVVKLDIQTKIEKDSEKETVQLTDTVDSANCNNQEPNADSAVQAKESTMEKPENGRHKETDTYITGNENSDGSMKLTEISVSDSNVNKDDVVNTVNDRENIRESIPLINGDLANEPEIKNDVIALDNKDKTESLTKSETCAVQKPSDDNSDIVNSENACTETVENESEKPNDNGISEIQMRKNKESDKLNNVSDQYSDVDTSQVQMRKSSRTRSRGSNWTDSERDSEARNKEVSSKTEQHWSLKGNSSVAVAENEDNITVSDDNTNRSESSKFETKSIRNLEHLSSLCVNGEMDEPVFSEGVSSFGPEKSPLSLDAYRKLETFIRQIDNNYHVDCHRKSTEFPIEALKEMLLNI